MAPGLRGRRTCLSLTASAIRCLTSGTRGQGTKIRENRMGSEPEMQRRRGPTGEGDKEGETGEEVEQLLPRHHALAAGRRHVRSFPFLQSVSLWTVSLSSVVLVRVVPVFLFFFLASFLPLYLFFSFFGGRKAKINMGRLWCREHGLSRARLDYILLLCACIPEEELSRSATLLPNFIRVTRGLPQEHAFLLALMAIEKSYRYWTQGS